MKIDGNLSQATPERSRATEVVVGAALFAGPEIIQALRTSPKPVRGAACGAALVISATMIADQYLNSSTSPLPPKK